LVVKEAEFVDPAVFGDDLAILVIGALLQEVNDNRPVWIEPLALQEFPQPAP
jgi:hypothetical protein